MTADKKYFIVPSVEILLQKKPNTVKSAVQKTAFT